MQTITNNKFVSPTTAGTMEWCRMGVAFSLILIPTQLQIVKVGFAFIISLIGTFLFMIILQKIKFKSALIVPLIGMMLGNVVNAVTTYFSYSHNIVQNVSSWLQGNFSLVVKGNYEILYLGIPFLIIAYIYASKFTIAGMGEEFAVNLGLNHKKVVLIGLIIVTFISSLVVVTIGMIPFIGLIIPNIISVYRGDNLRGSLYDTAVLGSSFVLLSDILGRVLIYPYEINVSVIVSILGSIVFLIILFKNRK